MKKILMACLNLLLVFNNVGFQAINATEVNPSSEETYEPGLQTEETDTLEDEETNESISIEENTNASETSLPTEEPSTDTLNEDNIQNDNLDTNKDEEDHIELPAAAEDDTIVNDSFDEETNEETTLEINNSDEAEQISTVSTDTVEFLNKKNFDNNLPQNTTNLYFGTKSDYDLSKCTETIDLGNNYTLYSYNDNNTYDVYVICEDGKQIFFPEDSSFLFSNYSKLKQIIFKNVNTSYVTDMFYMFNYCWSLTSLDLSNFNTSNVTDMSMMFGDCINLKTIIASNNFYINSNAYADSMFKNCCALTGGKGTKYDLHKTNKEYARVDGGPTKPGYFTDKNSIPIKSTLSVDDIYIYNGLEQTVVVTGYDSNTMNIEGNKATKPGTYTVTVTPKIQWSDGTKEAVTITWSIIKADPVYTLPTGLKATQGDKLLDITLPEGWKWNTPETQLTDAGEKTYKATFTPTDTNNYNVLTDIDVTVEVEFAPVKPTLSVDDTYTYTGIEQSVTVTGYESSTMDIEGNKATKVGDYTVTVTPKTQWSDGTKEAVTVTWSIIKANPAYTLPTDLKAAQGDKLSDITLPEGWKWNAPDTQLIDAGLNTFKATFTPEDTDNYNALTDIDLEVIVEETFTYLEKDVFRVTIEDILKDASEAKLYFGNIDDYSNLSSIEPYTTIGTNDYYSVYVDKNGSAYNVYVICKSGKKIHFPVDCTEYFAVLNNSNFRKIKNIEFKKIDAKHIENTTSMFKKLSLNSTLDLSSFNTKNATTLESMFEQFKGTTINFNGFNTSNVTSMKSMFKKAKLTGDLDLKPFDTHLVRNMDGMFEELNCNSLDLSSFNTENLDSAYSMFSNATINSDLDISHFKTDGFRWGVNFGFNGLKLNGKLTLFNTDKQVSLSLGDISVEGDLVVPFKNVSSFDCKGAYINGNLDLTNIDVSNFTSMLMMFADSKITGKLDISTWDTSSVQDMSLMFSYLEIDEINLSNFDTSSVTTMSSMFNGCTNLTELDLSNFDTSNVTAMSGMFSGCTNLTKLDLSNFDTSNVTAMNDMFEDCTNLTELDLSNFDTSNVTDMDYMFCKCSKLKTIYASEKFVTDKIDKDALLFSENDQLVGGYGTSFKFMFSIMDMNYPTNTKNYARIDTLEQKGYFTKKGDVIPNNIKFIDVDETTAHYEEIVWLANMGISKGWDVGNNEKEFRPYVDVARCDMAAFIRRLAQKYNLLDANTWSPSEGDWNIFIDINKNSPHAEDVLWLAHAGISSGWDIGNGRKEFRPLVSVARCDMAAFIRRLAAKAEIYNANTWKPDIFSWYQFVDIDQDSPHAEDVLWLASASISQGWKVKDEYGSNIREFRPLTNVARCDMAAFLYRLINLR